jgi:predicted  nucleic acid-binding Zn-ribbon protein
VAGFLEKFFGKKRKESGEEQPAAEYSLRELESLAGREREKKISEIYPACNELVLESEKQFTELKHAVNAFAAKELGDVQHRNVGREMKENFVKRVPLLLSIPHPKMKYEELREYSQELGQVLVSVTKIVSDNRYLTAFFPQEFEAFASGMKRLALLNDALKQKLESRAEAAKLFNEFSGAAREYQNLVEQVRSARENVVSLQARITNTEEDRKKALEGIDFSEKEKTERELELVSKKISFAHSEVSEAVSSLHRPLRKYLRVCLDKRESKVVEEYLGNPVEAIFGEEKGFPLLKKMLANLETAVAERKLGLDFVEKRKVLQGVARILGSEFAQTVFEKEAMEKRRQELEEKMKPFNKALEAKANAEAELFHLRGALEEAQEKAKELEKEILEAVSVIEEKAGGLVGKKVRLAPEPV